MAKVKKYFRSNPNYWDLEEAKWYLWQTDYNRAWRQLLLVAKRYQ